MTGWRAQVCLVVCCTALMSCHPAPRPVVGVTWSSTMPVPTAFEGARDALAAGRPHDALATCKTTMSTLQSTLQEALRAASIDGPPETAARVRELLETHVFATPAALVVADDHFIFSTDVLRLCSRAAFDAGAQEDAVQWLTEMATQTTLDAATARALQAVQAGGVDE